jgi:hypothetical protein
MTYFIRAALMAISIATIHPVLGATLHADHAGVQPQVVLQIDR